MAKTNVWNNPKFTLLAKKVGEPLPHVIGHLTALWHVAYDHYLPFGIMPRSEVELAAQWDGEPGLFLKKCVLTLTLRRHGRYVYIPNLLDHAPHYVLQRIKDRGLMETESARNLQEILKKSTTFLSAAVLLSKPLLSSPLLEDKNPPITPLTGGCDIKVSKLSEKDKEALAPLKSWKELWAKFEDAWGEYPRPIGRKEALKHFKASVKSFKDLEDLFVAIERYKEDVMKDPPQKRRKWQHGSTWFNNWQDWKPKDAT